MYQYYLLHFKGDFYDGHQQLEVYIPYMYHFEKFEKQNLEKVFRVQAEVFSFVAVQMRMMLQLMHHIRTALTIRLLKLSL